jgi:hypothetical protein
VWPGRRDLQPVPDVSAQYRHAINDAEAVEVWNAIEKRKTMTATRSAKHVVITFTVGYKREPFRLRVGGDIERPGTDELDNPIWIKVRGDEPRGLPSKQELHEAALKKVFADLPPFSNGSQGMYPRGVSCVGNGVDVIEIDVGSFSS